MKVDLSDTVLFNNFFSIVWFNLKLDEPVTGHIGFKGHECEWVVMATKLLIHSLRRHISKICK